MAYFDIARHEREDEGFAPMRPRKGRTKPDRRPRRPLGPEAGDHIAPWCVECGEMASLAPAEQVFPERTYFGEMAYVCTCGARVRCHSGTSRAMGYAANRQTARARYEAHQSFDRLWKEGPYAAKKDGRQRAYKWLASELHIRPDHCHFGLMTRQMCLDAIAACDELMTTRALQAMYGDGVTASTFH